MILYILLCGFPPFVSTDNEQEKLFERILSGQYEFTSPYWDNISQSAKELISNMLQAQPELRFSAEDVLDHPWLLVSPKRLVAFYTCVRCSSVYQSHVHTYYTRIYVYTLYRWIIWKVFILGLVDTTYFRNFNNLSHSRQILVKFFRL